MNEPEFADRESKQLDFTEDELLESENPEEPLIVSGTLCHGGIRSDGSYLSPRTVVRTPAINAWQEHHRSTFGTELLDAPIDAWPNAYPNLAQARHLLANGVRDPIISILTRIGTVEGFGAGLRYLAPGRLAPSDLQACFAEDDNSDGDLASGSRVDRSASARRGRVGSRSRSRPDVVRRSRRRVRKSRDP